MLSFQVLEQIESLRKILNSQENNEFTVFLNTLNDRREVLEASGIYIFDFDNTPVDVSRFVGEHQNKISSMTREIKQGLRPGSVFAGIRRLGDIFKKIEQGLNQKENCLKNIKCQLDYFEAVYEGFIDQYSPHVTIKLLNAATDLYHSLQSIESIFSLIYMSLQNHYELDQSQGLLSLWLDAGLTYRDFIKKLETIQNIYSRLCTLALIDEEEFPLGIVKIESGSLFVKVFGEPKIIGLMISLIQDTIGFMYRNNTKEGKIESINRKTGVLNSLLTARENLVAAGLPVEEFDRQLAQSAVFMAREFNCLLTDTSEININGEVMRLPTVTDDQKLLGSSERYLLEGAKDNPEQDE
jgi:hypothetical protein